MKKNRLQLSHVRKVVFALSFFYLVVVQFILLVFHKFIVYPYLISNLSNNAREIFIFVWITAVFTIPPLLLVRAFWKKQHIKLLARWERSLRFAHERKMRKIHELEELMDRMDEDRKNMYRIVAIEYGVNPFEFIVTLSEPLQYYQKKRILLLPAISVNGIPVRAQKLDKTRVTCHIRKLLTAEDTHLHFQSGTTAPVTINNPYYANFSDFHPIQWQCEGHWYERNIFLSANFFPHAHKKVRYEFHLQVLTNKIGTFKGSFDPEARQIIIPTGNAIHKSDCIGKVAILSLTYGKQNRISLPTPIRMIRDGRPLAVQVDG